MPVAKIRPEGPIDNDLRLSANRLHLRPLTLADPQGPYPNWLNDPEVCRYNSHGERVYTPEMAEAYITQVNASPTDRVFAVVDSTTDTHIGNIAIQKINWAYQNAEYAILMGDTRYWGKGYALEASKTLLDYGFGPLGLHRIYCGTSADNVPMQKLAVAMGMRVEGRQRDAMMKHGAFVDVLLYGALRDEAS